MTIGAASWRGTERKEPALTPLTDVVFLLLAFFMLAGQVQRSDAVAVAPPASSSEALPTRGVELLVTANGDLWWNDERIAADALRAAAAKIASQPLLQPLLVKADADLPVETLRATLATLRRAGVAEAALATRPRGAPP